MSLAFKMVALGGHFLGGNMLKITADTTDMDLISAFKKGDAPAGEELASRHYPRVLRFCCQRLRSQHDGKDVAQTVFCKVIVEKKIFEFRGQSRLSTWLIRIAINACNSYYSRNQRRHSNFFQYTQSRLVEEAIPCTCPSPEEYFSRDEQVTELHLIMHRLPAKYRQALVLTYLENRSYREAAGLLGIPITALGVQLLRGKKMLGSMLATSQEQGTSSFNLSMTTLANAAMEA
jgi:RNA polymerase sigma-70 factor (ECF subfamily)